MSILKRGCSLLKVDPILEVFVVQGSKLEVTKSVSLVVVMGKTMKVLCIFFSVDCNFFLVIIHMGDWLQKKNKFCDIHAPW